MPVIYLETLIKASPRTVFDLSRSVDLHKVSMQRHREEIVAGVKSGLMNLGDTVTWKARHIFKTRTLKVQLTELNAPSFFADEMLEGDFRMMRHEHKFNAAPEGTWMIDRFYFKTPFGFLGRLVDFLFLKAYMKRLLCQRNAEIKRVAESNLWKQFLT